MNGVEPPKRSEAEKVVKIDVITIFPKMVEAGLAEGVSAGLKHAGLLDIVVHNLRDFTTDKHHVVDDVPFGGGPGMVMKPEPFFAALAAIRERRGAPDAVVLLTPAGERFRRTARGWRRSATWCCCAGATKGSTSGCVKRSRRKRYRSAITCCRAARCRLAVIDAVARLVPGVVGDDQSVEADSFTRGLLDYPHYTRPRSSTDARCPTCCCRGITARFGNGGAKRRCSGRSNGAGPAGGRGARRR